MRARERRARSPALRRPCPEPTSPIRTPAEVKILDEAATAPEEHAEGPHLLLHVIRHVAHAELIVPSLLLRLQRIVSRFGLRLVSLGGLPDDGSTAQVQSDPSCRATRITA